MTDPLSHAERLLAGGGYYSTRALHDTKPVLLFESATVLGFAYGYLSPDELLKNWRSDYESTIRRLSFVFRRSGEKAWNCYAVFLAVGDASSKNSLALHSIEEDLSGTRKIARAGLISFDDVRSALLPLLPIQNAPQLEAVDMEAETRQRAQDVPSAALQAFFENRQTEEILQMLGDLK